MIMNDKPKSIWSRPWKGLARVLAWFGLLAGAVFLTVYCLGLLSDKNTPASVFALISVGVAALGVALVSLIRWLCFWRNFRRFLFGLACLATVIAVFYAEENVRGKYAWKQFKSGWEAKGERFDLASNVPAPVPDDQNFAMTPLWVETVCATMGAERGRTWYGDKVAALGHTNFVQRLHLPTELEGRKGRKLEAPADGGNWQKAEKADLKARQVYYRQAAAITNFFPVAAQAQTPAEDVLLALSRYDTTIEEIRRASRLPYSRFPIGYADANPAGILLPHLSALKRSVMTVQLRTLAELQAGQAEKALDDIGLMLRLTAAIRTEPFLVSHLVRISMLDLVLQPVWEGLGDHRWSDAQLAALGTELGKLDFLADYPLAKRGERACNVGMLDCAHGNWNREFLSWMDADWRFTPPRFPMWAVQVGPGGWIEQNKVAYCRMSFDLLTPLVNPETRIVSPDAEARARNVCQEIRVTPCNWSVGLLLPALIPCSSRFAHAQTAADLARVACALERYRLAQGNFPESLAALAPKVMERIPPDVISGQPLKYRRTDDGRFVLYSVGWNQTDDGGKPGWPDKEAAPGGFWREFALKTADGDWVWQYPAK